MIKIPSVAVLLSTERSGTHYLRSMLHNTGFFHAPGEVANASIGDLEADESFFFKFSFDFSKRNGPAEAHSINGIQKLMDEYIEFLMGISARENRIFLCDIKYSHVHNFNHYWWDSRLRPFLLDFLEYRNIPIIHLVRECVGNTAFSGIYAQKTQIWNTVNADDVKGISVQVRSDEMISEIDRILYGITTYTNWLSTINDVITVRYEDIVDDPETYMKQIMERFGLAVTGVKRSDFYKVTRSYLEIVENFTEIKDLLEYRVPEVAQRRSNV